MRNYGVAPAHRERCRWISDLPERPDGWPRDRGALTLRRRGGGSHVRIPHQRRRHPGGHADAARRLPGDDHAELELPAQPTCRSWSTPRSRNCCGPVLAATPRVAARLPPARRVSRRRCGAGDPRPLRSVRTSAVRIPSGSIRRRWARRCRCAATVERRQFSHWDAEHPGAAGLHTKDFKLEQPRCSRRAGRRTHRRSGGRAGDCARGRANPRSWCWASTRRSPACAMNWRRRCCSPTCCAGFRRRSSAASEISGGSVGAVKLVMDKDTRRRM